MKLKNMTVVETHKVSANTKVLRCLAGDEVAIVRRGMESVHSTRDKGPELTGGSLPLLKNTLLLMAGTNNETRIAAVRYTLSP